MSSPLLRRGDVPSVISGYLGDGEKELCSIRLREFGLFHSISKHPDFRFRLSEHRAQIGPERDERFGNYYMYHQMPIRRTDFDEDVPMGYFRQQLRECHQQAQDADEYYDFASQQDVVGGLKCLSLTEFTTESCFSAPPPLLPEASMAARELSVQSSLPVASASELARYRSVMERVIQRFETQEMQRQARVREIVVRFARMLLARWHLALSLQHAYRNKKQRGGFRSPRSMRVSPKKRAPSKTATKPKKKRIVSSLARGLKRRL